MSSVFSSLIVTAGTVLLSCAAAATAFAQPAGFPGWPLEWQGAELRRAPLTAGDRACVSGFSGVSARFTSGASSYLFRWTERPTRSLSSARDCYERAGYRVTDLAGPGKPGWACYLAGKTGESLRLCESIYTEKGERWALVDDWRTEAINDRVPGPFWSVVVSERAR